MSTILFILAAAAAVGGLISWSYEQERKRRVAIQGVAEGLGWAFSPDAQPSALPGFQHLQLYRSGRSQRIRNLVSGVLDGRRVAVFDFSYVTGAGKSQTTWRQTVAFVKSPGMDAPRFVLRPESVLHKIGNFFGYQDIDVEDDSRFSGRYLLRGQEEDSIRAIFGPELRSFFHNSDSCAEAVGPDLFFWYAAMVAPPESFPALVKEAVELAGRLIASGAVPSRPRSPDGG